MRCKKHPADQSCGAGVCASCLRQRLLAVIAAQVQAQALKQALHDCRKSDAAVVIPVEINTCRKRSRFSSLFWGIFQSKPEKEVSTNRNRGRGLSPEDCDGGSSGYSSDSQDWRETPLRRTPATARRGGGRAPANGRSLSGLTFCMSPLVRPCPNRHWNQKVAPPETVIAGEFKATPKPNLATATSFCKNRSRKLVDLGRYPYDRVF